ncbi:MAG: hypothetical protein MJ016_01910 [Victivallaceae bacterium]|nr:hypothetical protein [Victivallaceae bacterium]
MYEKIFERQQKIVDYTQKAKYYKLPELPECRAKLVRGNRAVVVVDDTVRAYYFWRNLWRKKAERKIENLFSVEAETDKIVLRSADAETTLFFACDPEENEEYLVWEINYSDAGNGVFRSSYFHEGAISDFTYISFKYIVRKENPPPYPFEKSWSDYFCRGANNRIFYTCSGHLYFGCAYLETEIDRVSAPERDDTELAQIFRLRETVAGPLKLHYYWFFGEGGEEHMGHLSNVLWRLDDSPVHTPQTDIADFVEKFTSIWSRSELKGIEPGDHYAAHFLSEFFGQFKDGYRPPDQFGCSWLEYDMLKANEFFRRWKVSGDENEREHAKKIIRFYLYNHFAGDSHLTYPFHTGAFMHDIMPFCEKTGWGAPFEAEALDSLALPEMIYDALTLYLQDETLFPTKYPFDIIDDVLKLQQTDGHFRRLYWSDLSPTEKPGWISQYSATQTWIPALAKIYQAPRDERVRQAYLKTAERCILDIEELGLFSMGGCETDYPDLWDVDGYRTMLWAFLDLYDEEKDPRFLAVAEKIQLFGSTMQVGYNIPNVPGSFYDSVGWRSRGMISTSYYTYPDYSRTQCTATGNQSVAWVGYLLLRLYRATGKAIYAQRAIATFRQVMIFRDEKSLEGNPFRDEILYSIYENNPQMDDESGLYKHSYPENSYSLFIDLYLYLGEILREFGGIAVYPDQKHAFGIDCVTVEKSDFGHRVIVVRNELSRPHETTLFIGGKFARKVTFNANETKTINLGE